MERIVALGTIGYRALKQLNFKRHPQIMRLSRDILPGVCGVRVV